MTPWTSPNINCEHPSSYNSNADGIKPDIDLFLMELVFCQIRLSFDTAKVPASPLLSISLTSAR